MPNLVVLFGPPASGKAAVGHELARLAGYRFFHNHLTVDPVAALFGWENERFPRTLERVRDVLFEEVASDDSIAGVVFTFVWEEDGERGLENIVTITFADAGKNKTRMTLHQTPFQSAGERDGHGEGWTSSFGRLGNFLGA